MSSLARRMMPFAVVVLVIALGSVAFGQDDIDEENKSGKIFNIVGIMIYFALALVALWGAFNAVVVWTRVGQKRFRSEDAQIEFLENIQRPLADKDYEGVAQMCQGDPRAMPQLIYLAVMNRSIGYNKVRQLISDRFQRDILADLEFRLSWVNTVIKSAPMLGLLGTVIGMMGAFAKLAAAEDVKPDALAENISVALITTACGLAIAIPLVMVMAGINIRIQKMEDLVGSGVNRFLEGFRVAFSKGK